MKFHAAQKHLKTRDTQVEGFRIYKILAPKVFVLFLYVAAVPKISSRSARIYEILKYQSKSPNISFSLESSSTIRKHRIPSKYLEVQKELTYSCFNNDRFMALCLVENKEYLAKI